MSLLERITAERQEQRRHLLAGVPARRPVRQDISVQVIGPGQWPAGSAPARPGPGAFADAPAYGWRDVYPTDEL